MSNLKPDPLVPLLSQSAANKNTEHLCYCHMACALVPIPGTSLMFRAVSPLSIPMSPCLFEEGPCCALCTASQLGIELQWTLVFSLADAGADFPSDQKHWNAFTHAAFRGGRLKRAQKLFLKWENPFFLPNCKAELTDVNSVCKPAVLWSSVLHLPY